MGEAHWQSDEPRNTRQVLLRFANLSLSLSLSLSLLQEEMGILTLIHTLSLSLFLFANYKRIRRRGSLWRGPLPSEDVRGRHEVREGQLPQTLHDKVLQTQDQQRGEHDRKKERKKERNRKANNNYTIYLKRCTGRRGSWKRPGA